VKETHGPLGYQTVVVIEKCHDWLRMIVVRVLLLIQQQIDDVDQSHWQQMKEELVTRLVAMIAMKTVS
jgi:hypothetical protein